MYGTFTILAFLLFLTSCSSPHIVYNNYQLAIKTKSDVIIEEDTILMYENKINLSNINIYQNVFKFNTGSIITYETVSVSSGYVFSYGVNSIVGNVFKKYNYDLIDIQGNIHFFKLFNKKETFYLIVENINKRGLKFIYGMNENSFNKIIDALKSAKTIKIENHIDAKNYVAVDYAQYIKSNWNMKTLILDNIVTKNSVEKFNKAF